MVFVSISTNHGQIINSANFMREELKNVFCLIHIRERAQQRWKKVGKLPEKKNFGSRDLQKTFWGTNLESKKRKADRGKNKKSIIYSGLKTTTCLITYQYLHKKYLKNAENFLDKKSCQKE